MNAKRFQLGQEYTRDQIKAEFGDHSGRGGNWDTGYHRVGNTVFLFATIGVPARTGHEYGDHWLPDGSLEWFGKTGTHPEQPLILFLTSKEAEVLLFARDSDRAAFKFEGQFVASRVFPESPVRIWWTRA